jgi:putative tryptophan/tyrosine transport system substrate-binding protein
VARPSHGRSRRAQQAAMPVVGVLNSINPDALSVFRRGLSETGHVEGLNVLLESRTTTQADQLPSLAAELVQRQVAVIAALGGLSAPAAKAATTTIPMVFSIGGDPVELGLVSNLRRPGGNITGITFFAAELLQKQVGLMRELV